MNLSASKDPSLGPSSIACISCKERKQKCDKSLPSCSRCERLLLKCRYSTSPSPLQASNEYLNAEISRNGEVIDPNVSLIQGFNSATAELQSHYARVYSLIRTHKDHFDAMVDAFFNSPYNWVPIMHQSSFRERCTIPQSDMSRGDTALILSMCLLPRPVMDGGQPDSLRVPLYTALKRLFWDAESIARPTLALIQSGVILSTYEYGHGMFDAAYMTISLCLSMSQVYGISKPPPGHDQPPLPVPGIWAQQDEGQVTWWAMLIHERMISLKTGTPIRPLNFNTPNDMDNRLLKPELADPLSVSFYYEARAAIFLDQVLDLIRNPGTLAPEGRLLFQALDRRLLQFLKGLLQQGLGSTCEAMNIGLCAFIQLHEWRLSFPDSNFSNHDRLESSGAIGTIIKIIADTGSNVDFENTENSYCQSPYSMHMMYKLLIQMHRLPQNERRFFYSEEKVLKMMLERQRWRWKIAGDYISTLHGDK